VYRRIASILYYMAAGLLSINSFMEVVNGLVRLRRKKW